VRTAVFLDRDGTINAMVYRPELNMLDSPGNPDEFELLDGAGQAIRLINKMGYLAIVISNQPGIAKGKFTPDLLRATTDRMHFMLAQAGARLDAVYYCLHHPDYGSGNYRLVCDCRKPKPGLLLRAARDWDINLASSYFIGDTVTDVLAGYSAGSMTCFLTTYKSYPCGDPVTQGIWPNYIASNLLKAVDIIRREKAEPIAMAARYSGR